MPKYIADSYLYRAIGADIDGACGKCVQSRSDCMCHSLSRMDICGIIDDAPTADVVERKRGRWIQRSDTPWYYHCSNCYRVISATGAEQMKKFHAFCGTCGADMREETEDATDGDKKRGVLPVILTKGDGVYAEGTLDMNTGEMKARTVKGGNNE